MRIWVSGKEKTCLALTREDKPSVDRQALEIIGLTPEEIALVELFFGRPTPAGVADSVRYAIWALAYLPKTSCGQITPKSYYAAAWPHGTNKIAHWFHAAQRAQDREGGDEPRLLAVLRKILAWCTEYEKEHPFREEYLAKPAKRKSGKRARRTRHSGPVEVVTEPAPEPVEVQVVNQQLALL